MQLSNRTYDIANWIVKIFLPAIITLYIALSQLWGFPHVEAVAGTLSAITVAGGTLLVKSNSDYKKQEVSTDGVLIFSTDDGTQPLVSIELDTLPADLYAKQTAMFRVDSR